MEQKIDKIVMPAKGVCNLAPDYVCDDNELRECIGMTYNDDALRPIQDVAIAHRYAQGDLIATHYLNSGVKHLIFGGNSDIKPFSLTAYNEDVITDSEGTPGGDENEDNSTDDTKPKIVWYYAEVVSGVLWIYLTRSLMGSTVFLFNVNIKDGASTTRGELKFYSVPAETDTVKIYYDPNNPTEGDNFNLVNVFSDIESYLYFQYNGADASNVRFYQAPNKPFFLIQKALAQKENSGGSSSGSKPIKPGDTTIDIYPAIFYTSDEMDVSDATHIASFNSPVRQIKSVGNTLIVLTEESIEYFLWKVGKDGGMQYKYLGNSIPTPYIRFALREEENNKGLLPTDSVAASKTLAGLSTPSDGGGTHFFDNNAIDAHHKEEFRNTVVASYSAAKKFIAENNWFTNPFFATVAIELYDGSYVKMAAPQLLMPTIYPASFTYTVADNGLRYISSILRACSLRYKLLTDYSDWEDIIKDVCIFVSEQTEVYDMADNSVQGFFINRTFKNDGSIPEQKGILCPNTGYRAMTFIKETNTGRWQFMPVKSENDIIKELSEVSNFYLLTRIGIKSSTNCDYNDVTTWDNASKLARKYTLANILTADRISDIEFYSHCNIIAAGAGTFNRRLNLHNVQRGFFDGFLAFMPYRQNNSIMTNVVYKYRIVVTIEAQSGLRCVKKDVTTSDIFYDGMWFYYPDPRAKRVYVYRVFDNEGQETLALVMARDLKEHRGLNGAYCIGKMTYDEKGKELLRMPDGDETVPAQSDGAMDIMEENTTPEYLSNYIMQSDVDNPFTFKAASYVRIGQGRVLGMSALTTALAQDAYKVATTIVFTTQGIWAIRNNDEGIYANVTPAFSREVCTNPESITMVDNAIFFVSAKGLMCIDDDGVRCVSRQLSGKDNGENFRNFLESCHCAYDYRNSQLWLINREYSYHWIYNIISGTFSKKIDDKKYSSIVNDYPDTLLQNGNMIFSLYNKPDINYDNNEYSAVMETRPMKFQAALKLKAIHDIKHMMDIAGNLELSIFVSNNLVEWQKIDSLYGQAYKFYRFRYEFTGMHAHDTFSGTAISLTMGLTNKFR